MNSWKDHYWFTVPVMRKRIETIIELVGTGKTVLECGCNEGFVSAALQENNNTVLATDFSQEMVDKAREMFNINTQQADVMNLPFKDETFQVVVAGELLEHTSNPFKALGELFRVSSEKVIITLPIGEYWLGELTHIWKLDASFIGHDSAQEIKASKHELVLCWERKRTNDLVDIPPFNTVELKKKYGIN